MTLIIGLCGPKFAGKSTVAKALVKALPSAAVVSFAAPLKAMLTVLLESSGMDQDDIQQAMTTPEGKETPLAALCTRTLRHAMETLGTEWGRQLISPDLWTRIAMMRATTMPVDVVVIDDARFDSEIAAILKHGGRIVEVSRIGATYSLSHESARRPKFVDCDPVTLYNNGLPHSVAMNLLRKINHAPA